MEDALEARLLPGCNESRKSRKPSVILLLSLLLNAIFLIVTLSVSYGYFDKKPQWADAIQAAEKAAANLCSGHGDVFVDTMGVNADGSLACECNDCFTGADCSVVVANCASNADRLLTFLSLLYSSRSILCVPEVNTFLYPRFVSELMAKRGTCSSRL